jgi:hypothetical protein
MIILLGFPKSGTTSFHTLFKKLGYKSYHQHFESKKVFIAKLIKDNKRKKKPLLGFIKNKNACLTQLDVCHSHKRSYWPQLVDYEQLYNENKESIFILNKRNPEDLLDSFKKWNGPKRMKMRSKFERIFDFNPELFNGIEGNTKEEKFINLVNRHYNNVIDFFKDRKDAKFIEYKIETDDINKLSNYIKLKKIKSLPHKNINKNIYI